MDGLSNNDQVLHEKLVQIDNLLGLYLEYRKDTEEFNKFVIAKAKKFEQRSKDKKGT